MTNSRQYYIWLRPAERAQSETEGVERCLSKIDLLPKKYESSVELGEVPLPLLLEHAPEVVAQLLIEMLSIGFVVRLSLPADTCARELQGSRMTVPDDVPKLMQSIIRYRDNEYLYPIDFWGIPPARGREVEVSIEAFEDGGRTVAMLEPILMLGGVYIILLRGSITLAIECANASRADEWTRSAVRTTRMTSVIDG
jgi:hypothetical protein